MKLKNKFKKTLSTSKSINEWNPKYDEYVNEICGVILTRPETDETVHNKKYVLNWITKAMKAADHLCKINILSSYWGRIKFQDTVYCRISPYTDVTINGVEMTRTACLPAIMEQWLYQLVQQAIAGISDVSATPVRLDEIDNVDTTPETWEEEESSAGEFTDTDIEKLICDIITFYESYDEYEKKFADKPNTHEQLEMVLTGVILCDHIQQFISRSTDSEYIRFTDELLDKVINTRFEHYVDGTSPMSAYKRLLRFIEETINTLRESRVFTSESEYAVEVYKDEPTDVYSIDYFRFVIEKVRQYTDVMDDLRVMNSTKKQLILERICFIEKCLSEIKDISDEPVKPINYFMELLNAVKSNDIINVTFNVRLIYDILHKKYIDEERRKRRVRFEG